MPNKFNERAEWLKLAKAWDEAEPDIMFGDYLATINGELSDGLCQSINLLVDSPPRRSEMRERMNAHKPKGAGKTWWWRFTKQGANARAAFCRKMAELCNPK